ncbi:MAG: helix-hairpin-helix domain-containing protein [Candidatus Altiarchaeota archaeon]
MSGKREGDSREEVLEKFVSYESIDDKLAGVLYDSGIISLDELKRLTEEELAKVPGVDNAKAAEIKSEVGFEE